MGAFQPFIVKSMSGPSGHMTHKLLHCSNCAVPCCKEAEAAALRSVVGLASVNPECNSYYSYCRGGADQND